MYKEYFGLKEKPFSIVPNPHYFYMSEGHREAMAHLRYGIKGEGGFVLLTGEVGAGKTTVCRVILQLLPQDLEVAFLLNPPLTVEELLATVCDEFGISYSSETTSIKAFVAKIQAYLLDAHARARRAILVVEEAQNLSTEVLEQIRLLTNLETNEHKLLQIIMIGQPELRDKLSQPELRQLSQRITARYHLGPLSKKEIPEYVNFRLLTAGLRHGHQLFPARTIKKLYRLSGGLPRLINSICDRALLGAYVQGKGRVDVKTLLAAASEVLGDRNYGRRSLRIYQGMAAGFALLLCTALAATYLQRTEPLTGAGDKTPVEEHRVKADPAAVVEIPMEKSMDLTLVGTKEAAYQALFSTWQIEYKPDEKRTVCEQAREQGLRCLEEGKGTMNNLREANKPAVLRLHAEKGGEYYVMLAAVEGEAATCVIGNETEIFDVNKIIRQWSGDYLILWRVFSDYKGKLRPGRRGPLVAWLARELALAQGRTVRPGPEQVYNEEIVRQVKEFQRAEGLTPDGVAGLGTIAKLTAAAGKGEPALNESKAGN
jgi:general secretion pathway protein A